MSLHQEGALCSLAGAGAAEDENDFIFAGYLVRGETGGRKGGRERMRHDARHARHCHLGRRNLRPSHRACAYTKTHSPILRQASKQARQSHHTGSLPFAARQSCYIHACLPHTPQVAGSIYLPAAPHHSTPDFLSSLAYATYCRFSAFFFFLLRYNAAAAPPRTITAAVARSGNCFFERVKEVMAMNGRRRLLQLLLLVSCPVPVFRCRCDGWPWWNGAAGNNGVRNNKSRT